MAKQLGQGTFGTVYALDEQTALKVPSDDPEVLVRSLSILEVDTVSRLRSPYLVEGRGITPVRTVFVAR